MRHAVAILLAVAGSVALRLDAATVPVADVTGLRNAVATALPGDDIVLAPGDYLLSARVSVTRPGAAGAPIRVRAGVPGCTRLLSDTVEAFNVSAPYWTFEDLEMEGVCADDSSCEHAFHVVEAADFFTLRHCSLHDFNAQIKGNGVDPGGGWNWPDDVLIEDSEIYDTRGRNTANPVTKIDVVGGQRWVVRHNFIHDAEKLGGDTISYAAFLKGNGKDGLFEGNLVACSLATTGGTRVGLSFGGGGSSPDTICELGSCTPEHRDGLMRNNVIVNCDDVGIYLNECASCQVDNNTLYDNAGIDVRFVASVVDLRNNLLSGRIRTRDGGTMTVGSNLENQPLASFQGWFQDPAALDFRLKGPAGPFVDAGESVASVSDDFCGQPRAPGPSDVGAVEYAGGVCDTRGFVSYLKPGTSAPPAGVGNTLRGVRTPSDVVLGWSAGSDAAWNVYRDASPGGTGTTLWIGLTGAPSAIDVGGLGGAPLQAYRVRAVAVCSGLEAE